MLTELEIRNLANNLQKRADDETNPAQADVLDGMAQILFAVIEDGDDMFLSDMEINLKEATS